MSLQVKEVCDQMTEELVGQKAAFTQLKEKEKKSASLVLQLTAMVKEQKSRISQLNKAKNDAVTTLKVLQVHEVKRLCSFFPP